MIESEERRRDLKFIEVTRALMNDERTPEMMREVYVKLEQEQPALMMHNTGANFDARALMADLGKRLFCSQPARTQPAHKDAIALVMAGVTRCAMTHRCAHAVPLASVSLIAMLSARLLTCKSCLAQFIELLQAHDETIAQNTECDLCLDRGVKKFFRFAVALGNIVIMGDVCPKCRASVGSQPAASEKGEPS
jgi:hypothetical protein